MSATLEEEVGIILVVEFRRGERCEHNSVRECSPCFLAKMREAYGVILGDDFEEAWARRAIPAYDDTVDSFTAHLHDDRVISAVGP